MSLAVETIIEENNTEINLPYKKHLNLSSLTGFTLSMLKIDFHTLNIISTCHLNE